MKKCMLTALIYLFMFSPFLVGILLVIITKNYAWLSVFLLYLFTYGIGYTICEKYELGN